MNSLVALVTASLLVAADAKDDDIKKELAKLRVNGWSLKTSRTAEKRRRRISRTPTLRSVVTS